LRNDAAINKSIAEGHDESKLNTHNNELELRSWPICLGDHFIVIDICYLTVST